VPKGCSTVDRLSRINSGVARWCMRVSASSSGWRLSMRCGERVQRGFSEQAPQSAAEA
jgi:hypothetical protein